MLLDPRDHRVTPRNSVWTFKWTPSQTLNVSSLVAATRSGEFRWGVFFVFATCWSVTVISRAMLVVCHKFPRTRSPHFCIYLPQVWPGRVVGGGLRVVSGLAGLQVGCAVNTVVVVRLTPNTGVVHLQHRVCGTSKTGVVHLKHQRCGIPQTPVWFTLNTRGVVHLKHRCGSPQTPGVWYTLHTGVVHLKHQGCGTVHLKHQGCGTP